MANVTGSKLFEPFSVRGVTARNRIMVSPMQQYASADHLANDYHLVHYGRMALGGAGIIIVEATAIDPVGRIATDDLGLWDDRQIGPLARISRFLTDHGAVPGIQLLHSGRKGSTQAPWAGAGPLTDADAALGTPPWPLIGPSALSAGPGWPVPSEMSHDQIEQTIRQWADAAVRAVDAGFRVINLHGAHGYLLHSFLSPLSNQRSDEFGGSLAHRMRYPLMVVEAIRAAIPDDIALFYRLSLLDGVEGGWTLEDSVQFARNLYAHGVDLVDCSSGGAVADRSSDSRVRRGYAFHAPYSRHLRAETGGLVASVGLIIDPHQAEAVLNSGDADLVAMGREILADPNWPNRARIALEGEDYSHWHRESGWWLERRAAVIRNLTAAGETPLTRYQGTRRQAEPASV